MSSENRLNRRRAVAISANERSMHWRMQTVTLFTMLAVASGWLISL
jgi:hypothetical protein